jgi:hypothetical protein
VLSYGHTDLVNDNYDLLPYHGDAFIDLDSENIRLRALKVLNYLDYCFAIHGIFRHSIMKELNFEVQASPDRLMLFTAALCGRISYSNETTYTASAPRKETSEQFIKRLQGYALTKFTNVRQYHKEYALSHLSLIMKTNKLGFFTKLRLVFNTFVIMNNKHKISPFQIIFS